MEKWIQYRRKTGNSLDNISLVSIRPDQIALNASFVAIAQLGKKSHVHIFTSCEQFQLGFKFYDSPPDYDAIALSRDGGSPGSGGGGRCIQVAGLMRENAWLAAVARIDNPRLRRFEPKWNSTYSRWVVSLCPSFETRLSSRTQELPKVDGIYRYKRRDEIVYIGRGQIRSRLNAGSREQWDFETIEYSIVSDENEQAKWETWWLDRFVETYGKLPLYNQISGTRPSDQEHG